MIVEDCSRGKSFVCVYGGTLFDKNRWVFFHRVAKSIWVPLS